MKSSDILVVVDMQNDFIDGSLGTEGAQKIVDKVVEKVADFSGKAVIFTKDTHDNKYLNTYEGKKLPVMHCIKGTQGWEISNKIKTCVDKYDTSIILKDTFGTFILSDRIKAYQYSKDGTYIDADKLIIEIIGLCTDICVVSNAIILKAAFPNSQIIVDASCCAGTTPENHEKALDVMRSCHITVINDIRKGLTNE